MSFLNPALSHWRTNERIELQQGVLKPLLALLYIESHDTFTFFFSSVVHKSLFAQKLNFAYIE